MLSERIKIQAALLALHGGKDYTERWADIDKYPQTPQKISGKVVQKVDARFAPEEDKEMISQLQGDHYYIDGVIYTLEEAKDILDN